MKLLIITQKMDIDDPVLGFFHNWVSQLSLECKKVSVICLEKGHTDLPNGVSVYSLGKENYQSKLNYIRLFFSHLLLLRRDYDAVFVHMNQEYILLAGWYWKIMGRPIYMWRNHHAGNFLTNIAVYFCRKVFCTSQFSYTARFKKVVLMPVGIDLGLFNPSEEKIPESQSMLFLGRISPVKKAHVLIKAATLLQEDNLNFSLDFYGDALAKDKIYFDEIKEEATLSLGDRAHFYAGVPNYQTPEIYRQHLIFINLSSSGMYDKTIFEAMACGSLILACNRNLIGKVDPMFIFKEDDATDLAQKIKNIFLLSDQEKEQKRTELMALVRKEHSLESLRKKIIFEIEN